MARAAYLENWLDRVGRNARIFIFGSLTDVVSGARVLLRVEMCSAALPIVSARYDRGYVQFGASTPRGSIGVDIKWFHRSLNSPAKGRFGDISFAFHRRL